ncbi:MAG: fatty acid desaturase [Hydrocarboniphaga sp.]|uniref:fatty acid desaturase n=1 Tax=Hydrocarboniphaga sp. TaxID=2033016 RepID=UPI002621F5F5|nr:fatty acid desaturase [Hydrocarboniphaga sp.]MDB5969664.1 fatty acid desaturase [Hydrocarboniphaga sp.]
MSSSIIAINELSPERRALFKRLTSAPRVAWPTVLLWLGATLSFIVTDTLAVTGEIPLWIGTLINGTVGYLAFSVGHDSIHRAISTNVKLNDWIGQLGILLVAPYVNMPMFRWAHILHHRFTNGERDPDRIFNGPWWSLPFRWMFIDLLYFKHALQKGDKISKPYLRKSIQAAIVVAAVIAGLTWAGYGMEVLMLWAIPSRIIFLALGFSFFWLPHVPHDTAQEDNFTRATTIREGHEWLMAPVLQYQHAHLIHHLFPMTPFYNNGKVWKLLEPELRRKDLAIQHGFAIRPTIYPGIEAAAVPDTAKIARAA